MTTEAKVGAFVLGCFALLAFTMIYLLNAQYSGGTVQYRTYLRYAGGLEPGASVLYGGMNVGKVTAVHPWTTDPTRIEILLQVKKDTPLNEKSVAKLGFVSVMNSAALSVTTGSIDAKRLTPESTIPSKEAASLDEIAKQARGVVNQPHADPWERYEENSEKNSQAWNGAEARILNRRHNLQKADDDTAQEEDCKQRQSDPQRRH